MDWFAQIQPQLEREYYSLVMQVHVAPSPADLTVAILEPGNYELRHDLKVSPDAKESDASGLHLTFSAQPRSRDAPSPPAKGTIFLLHGVMMNKECMLHWGLFLAQKGYRTVLVDLRGHGRSSGKFITYGARETIDLSRVLDELFRRGLVSGRVGVLGLSYGGAIAIQWAAHELRVAAVVALAPFSDARRAVDEFSRALAPDLMKHVSAGRMAAALDLAAQRGSFSWGETDVLAAARHLRYPLLLFHGAKDTWIPRSHSDAIKAAAPPGSELRIGPGNHLTISLRLHPMADPVAAWFERFLVAAH